MVIAGTTLGTLMIAALGAKLDIGIRYLLPAFPFLHLLLGGIGARAARTRSGGEADAGAPHSGGLQPHLDACDVTVTNDMI